MPQFIVREMDSIMTVAISYEHPQKASFSSHPFRINFGLIAPNRNLEDFQPGASFHACSLKNWLSLGI